MTQKEKQKKIKDCVMFYQIKAWETTVVCVIGFHKTKTFVFKIYPDRMLILQSF